MTFNLSFTVLSFKEIVGNSYCCYLTSIPKDIGESNLIWINRRDV